MTPGHIFARKELPVWFSSSAVALDVLGRGAMLVFVAPFVHRLALGWTSLLRRVVGGLETQTGRFVSPFYRDLAGLDLELVAVLAIAFLYFGFEPYWVQARRANVNVTLNYFFHLLCWTALLFLLAQGAGFGWSPFWVRFASGGSRVPHGVLEQGIAETSVFLLACALLWHPGIALRVLVAIILLLGLGMLVPPAAEYVVSAWYGR